MPILVKSDDVKWKKGQGSSQPVTSGTGINGVNVIFCFAPKDRKPQPVLQKLLLLISNHFGV